MTDQDRIDNEQPEQAPAEENSGAGESKMLGPDLGDDFPRTIWWEDGKVRLIDQSRLPLVGDILECDTHTGVCVAIRSMAVRGAPALGIAAALGIATWAMNEAEEYKTHEEFFAGLEDVADAIKATRPTAVNLLWGAERLRRLAYASEMLPSTRSGSCCCKRRST